MPGWLPPSAPHIYRVTIEGDLDHCACTLQTSKLSTSGNEAAKFSYIQFLKDCIGGYFRDTRTTAGRTADSIGLQNFTKRGIEDHEDNKAGDAGNDNCGSPFHPDPQSVLGRGWRSHNLQSKMCDVPWGEAAGKPAAKIPSLVSDDTKKASDDDLTKDITEKAKHPATVKSLPRSGKDGRFVHS
jgi:hypothetical protein